MDVLERPINLSFRGFAKKCKGETHQDPTCSKIGASLCYYVSLDLYVVLTGGPLAASGNVDGEFHGAVRAFGHLEVI